MKNEQFPSCCAINLLTGFGRTHTSFSLDSTEQEMIDFIQQHRKNYYEGKIQMIVLNEVQLASIGRKMFLKLGFRIRCLGLYTGHGNKIYVLTYNPNGNPAI